MRIQREFYLLSFVAQSRTEVTLYKVGSRNCSVKVAVEFDVTVNYFYGCHLRLNFRKWLRSPTNCVLLQLYGVVDS